MELLGAGDVAYPSSSASIDSYTHLTAGFPANFAAPGVYSIRVSQPGGSFATLTNAFEILPPGEPRLVTRLILPSLLGRHALATLYVEYGNEGNASMAAPLLVLKSNDPHHADQPILTQDPSRIVQNFWSDVTTPGVANEVFILASGSQPGVLNPGERIQVPVYYLGLRPPWDFHAEQVELEIRYWLADDHFPIDWSERKETLRPPTLDPETWDIVYANLTAELPDTGAYIRMLNDNAQSLARLGQRVTDVDKLWNFEVQQAYGHSPLPFLDSTVDASMPAPGVALQLSRSYAGHLRARNATGFFGRGWYTPWMSRLVVENEGAQIKILGDAGSAQHFTRDLRDGTYFSQPGETSTLVPVSSNAYELRDIHGIVTAFRTDGKLHYIRDPNGNKVTATYDGSALLTSLTHSSGATLDIAYNGDGFVQSVTDSAGRTTRYLYNGSLLETVTTDDGKITQYTYETAGPPVLQHALAAIARHGTTRHFTYDLKGRLLATWIAEEEELATFGYDSAGGVTATDAQGTTGLFFDHRGLLARTVNPLGHVTTSEFDEDLHPRRQVLPTGETRSYTWCSCGSPTSITDELGQTTRFSYEHPFKRLTGFTDALGNSTHYTYDDKGNRIATTYPNTSTEYFSDYTAVGLSQSYTNRRGQTIISTYTIAGLLDRQTFEDGSYADFDYDARGNLIRILEQPGSAAQKTTLYEYVHATDGDRLRRVTYPNGRWVEFFYDAFGRRERMTDSAGGNTRYQYDPAGRLWRLRDAEDSLLVEYLYNASGRLDRITRGNGTYTIYEYDAAGQILHLVNHALNGAINTRFDYTYDSRGRRRSMATVDGLWSYEYDGTSQLIRAAFASSHPAIENQDFEYKYDALGNRMFTIVNGIRTEYVANNMNQYLSVGSLPQEYDADGNLISDGLRTYGYDTLNRLTSILGRDGLTQYGYHAAGSRDRTTRNGEPTEYLMDPMGMVDVIAEFDATGMPTARSVHGIGLVGRYSASGGLHYFEFDAIGSTTAMTDPTGGVANAYAYRPFGEMLDEGETAPNSLRFVGQFGVSDNGDGTHYMRARFYDALAGRFMSSDPIGLQGGDPNLYRYVQNSAPNGSDPLGLDFSGQFSYFAPNGLGLQVGFSKGANDGGCVSVNPGLGFKSPGVGLGGGLQAGVGGSVIGSGSPTGLSWNGINFELSGGVVACNASWGLYGLSGGCSAQKSSGFGVSLTSGATYCAPPPASPPPPSPPTGSAGASGASATAGATDPNQKLGPEGAGAGHHVLSGVTLPYRVDFENDRDASAPAQFVRVTDQLSSDFDGSSFRLTEIGFGDHMIPVPPNRQHFKTTIAASYGGRTFDVHVEVGLRAESGQIYATFQSIDPATGLPPPVEIGFLPPEDGTGRGQGHFSYRIDARSDLPTGREIRNVAFIEFDRQASIATNQRDAHDPSAGTDPDKEALVTIDAGPPSGTVAPLPESVASPSFPVAWTGEDDAGGSGVADYTIYVSADDGPWLIWLERATVASANFPGSAGHSYRFRCVARDRVGHVEDDPGVAEASTRVEVGAAAVIGRYVSYNNSVWDGRDGAANAQDDAAIAPDKTPLLPGGTATFANYTSFDRGLNSVIIDIEGLGGIPTVADLEFRTGNSSDPSAWNLAPNPIELAFRTGAGAGGSDRITLIWLDNAIQKQWLQVHVLATPNTGLANPDVFYFGNAIGDSGDNTSNAQVNVLDEAAVRAHPHNFLDPAPLNSAHDFNRDRNVNVLDEAIARANATSFLNALKLITVPTTSSADAGLNARGLTFGVATRDPEIGSGTPRQQLAMLPAQAHEPDAGSPETDETGQMRISASAVGDRLVISVPTLPGRVYRLERADTLAPGAWTEELASPRSGVTGVASWSIALARSVSHRFYRVRIDSEY
ncbi:MAG: RHS repeat-associated core domain-containing protein [Limisphaerales bacterium]